MSKIKKYFWLKLDKDFFKSKAMKKLRKIAGGDTYTIIYLKMQLLSLENTGLLFYEGIEETFPEEVALEIDESVDDVSVTITFLIKVGLLEQVNENTANLPNVVKSTGSESDSAERVRKHRQKMLQCNTNVTDSNKNVTTEIELRDRVKRLEKENKNLNQPGKAEPLVNDISEIIDFYNKTTGQRCKKKAQKNISLIKARIDEGVTIDEFKIVIEKMFKLWKGTEQSKYIRPETLFGNKFDGYLNIDISKPTQELHHNSHVLSDEAKQNRINYIKKNTLRFGNDS